jgi:hypothetical protein
MDKEHLQRAATSQISEILHLDDGNDTRCCTTIIVLTMLLSTMTAPSRRCIRFLITIYTCRLARMLIVIYVRRLAKMLSLVRGYSTQRSLTKHKSAQASRYTATVNAILRPPVKTATITPRCRFLKQGSFLYKPYATDPFFASLKKSRDLC